MDERKTHIDEFFRRQMGNHTETPPPAIWDALEKRLDTPPGRKKPFPVWWFYTIAGLILISATAILAGYLNNNPVIIAQHQPAPHVSETAQADEHPVAAQNTVPAGEVQQQIPQQHTVTLQQPSTEPGNDNNVDAIAVQSPQRPAEQLAPARQNNIQTINNDITGKLHSDLNKVRLPEPAKQKDQIPVMTPKLPADNIAATALPATKQIVQLPVVPVAGLREDEELSKLTTAITGTNNIPAAELLASVNPMSTAFTIAQREMQNIPGPETLLQEETLPVQHSSRQTDTSKKKRGPLTDTTSILEQTVYPVISKKKVPLPVEIGFKAGYSKGFGNTWTADKIAIAPYIEYRLPSNFSVILQPTYHTGKAKTGAFANGAQNYHQLTDSAIYSTMRVARGKVDSSILTPNPPDTVFRTYTYLQTYDSIHVSYGVTQTQLWDIELPVMVKYKINKNFSAFAGGSVTYSSVLQTKEEVTRYAKRHEFVDNIDPVTYFVTTQGQPPPEGPAQKSYSNLFSYNTNTFDKYQPRQVAASNNFFRYGFMIGASATFKERWMIDVMLHKTGVDANAVPDKELQKIYTRPYLRVMVGYKLLK